MTTPGPATQPLDPEPPHWRPLMTESTTLAALRLAEKPPWAPDMPLAAAGFETARYRKE